MQTPTNPPASGAPHATDTGRFLRLPAVLSLVALGRSAWLDLVARKKAPAPMKIGRAAVWDEGEVRQFMETVRQSRAAK